jgi:nuclear pore complex protein Nup160
MQGRRQGELVYLLYVLTVSGVALLCHLRSPSSYLSGSVLHQDDIVEFSLQTHAQSAKVTAVTAKPGCLVIGRQDGSICSYSLGKLAPNTPGMSSTINSQKQTHCSRFNVLQVIGLGAFCSSPHGFWQLLSSTVGFLNELRDDAGIGRLWTLISRYYFAYTKQTWFIA